MALRLVFILSIFSFAPLPVAFADPFDVKVLVNTAPITQFEIDSRIALLQSFGDERDTATLRKQAINTLIDEALQLELAEQQGVLPSREDAAQTFANIAENNQLSVSEFESRLREQGINVAAFKSRLLPQMAWNAALGVVARSQIIVSDEDLEARWAEIQADRGKTERRLIEVFLSNGSQSQAESVAQRMRESEDFGNFARATSHSPLAANNGNRGWVQDDALSNAARQALQELEVGDVSTPIRQDGGYYIYGLVGIRPVGSLALIDVFDVRELYITLEAQGQSENDAQKLQTLQNVFRRVDNCERFNQAVAIYGEGKAAKRAYWL